MQYLTGQALNYRLGRLSQGQYYAEFTKQCERRGVDTSRYKAFQNYVGYARRFDKIHIEDLGQELQTQRQVQSNLLAKNDREREIISLEQDMALIQKLLKFELTAQQWQSFVVRQNKIESIGLRFNALSKKMFLIGKKAARSLNFLNSLIRCLAIEIRRWLTIFWTALKLRTPPQRCWWREDFIAAALRAF